MKVEAGDRALETARDIDQDALQQRSFLIDSDVTNIAALIQSAMNAQERELLSADEKNVICGACGILDVVKGEWAGSWGEYDQGIRDGLTKILARCEAERLLAERREGR
jgi:hypothetical protein